MLPFHQTIHVLSQISKTRHNTNVVCCEVKILHSELFPGSSAIPKLSAVNAGGYIVRSFITITITIITYIPLYPCTPKPRTHIPPGE